jgi:hypothetical protein
MILLHAGQLHPAFISTKRQQRARKKLAAAHRGSYARHVKSNRRDDECATRVQRECILLRIAKNNMLSHKGNPWFKIMSKISQFKVGIMKDSRRCSSAGFENMRKKFICGRAQCQK